MNLAAFTGWMALSLFALGFCTPVRSPKVNALIGGYRLQLQIHHWMGVASIAFMFLHLGVLAVDYSSSPGELFEWGDLAVLSGWIAIICSTIVAGVAFKFRTTPYRKWRRIHLVLIAGFLTGILHAFLLFEPRTILEWGAVVVTALIGGAGIAWGLWLPQLPAFGVPYVISSQNSLGPDLFSQSLIPADPHRVLQFKAGEFVFLRYCDPLFTRMWHPFTVVRFSESGAFELLVKARGRDTDLLNKVSLPCHVRINGPFGEKFWVSDVPQIWIAYGVGIAIFLAAARTIPEQYQSMVRLVYCEKNEGRIVFAEEIDEISAAKKQFTWTQSFGEGPDVVKRLRNEFPIWSRSFQLFRVCGHPGFQNSVRKGLLAAGVARDAIVLEGVF